MWFMMSKMNMMVHKMCAIVKDIHAICPGLARTVPDFDTLSRRPGKYEIVPEILKNKVD